MWKQLTKSRNPTSISQANRALTNSEDHGGLDMAVESLESRLLLAGNIRALVTAGGDLRIVGDSASNEVAIHSTGTDGELFFEGLNGTTINGQDSIMLNGINDDVRVSLGRGNDRFLLTGALDDGSTASAIDFLDDIRINAGGGDDVVYLDGVVGADDIGIATGRGDDAIGLFVTSSDNVVIATGSGNDVVGFAGANVVEESTLVLTGGGNDVVGVRGDSSGYFATRFGGVFAIGLGGGNDMVAVEGGHFAGGSIVNGGFGTDSVQTVDAVLDFPPILIGVEFAGDDVDSVYTAAFNNPTAVDGLALWLSEGIGQFF